MAAKIKKGDKVVVLTGKDKGKTGRFCRCSRRDPGARPGLNLVRRHTKQTAPRMPASSPRKRRSI